MDQRRSRAINNLLQRCLWIRFVIQIAGFEAKPGGYLHKVNHPRICRRKNALLIEQTLLLIHQTQRFVIHQDDFNIQLIFAGRRHFLNIHHQATVAGEAQHLFVRVGQRCANCRRQAKAHGSQTAGGQPLTRTVQRVSLCGPHLMLAYVGGDNGIVIHAGRYGVDQPIVAERVAFLRNAAGEFAL